MGGGECAERIYAVFVNSDGDRAILEWIKPVPVRS
jgi:hypothetical protein